MPALSPVAALVVCAVSLSTQTVPAAGREAALVTLDQAAMVRLAATSGSGTACEIVDRVRGPFARSGQAGRSNCQLDLLLDKGTYKVRLESARRGKGQAKLSAAEFTELNPAPKRLVPSALQRFTLKSGQQASFWLSLSGRGVPFLRVSGRTAGDVRLWRNGEWVEPVTFEHAPFSPEPGRPVHEWWLSSPVDRGDYLVRIYGTQEQIWPGGNENDEVEVELGFRDGPPSRALPFTLGRSGVAAVRVPGQAWAAILTLDVSPSADVQLQQLPGRGGQRCWIQKKALVPQCGLWTGDWREPDVLLVRGPAGTSGMIEWAPRDTAGWYGGYYGTAAARVPFRSRGGLNLVALHDLPVDPDAAPLGCMVTSGEQRLAWDFPVLGEGRSLDARFNYDGSGALVWFDVKRAGRYRVETKGGRKSRCALYRFATASSKLERLTGSAGDSQTCALTVQLEEGSHQLSLFEGAAGVEQLYISEDGRKDAKPIPTKAGCLLGAVALANGEHWVQTNRVGAVSTRGVIAEALPLSLDVPLHLTLDPGRSISLPLARPTVAIAQTSAGTSASVGPELISLSNPTSSPLQVTVFAPASLPAPPALETFAPKLEPLRVAKADAPVFFDFERGESHSMAFDVETAGLYNVSTQGLLATHCALRTPVISDAASDTGSGRGRNCLVSGYLQPGRYLLTATAVGESRGRASVLLTRRPVRTAAQVGSDGEAFFRAAAGELMQQKLVVPAGGPFELATTAQGTGGALRCRLDDPDGWPLTTVPTSCSAPRTFAKGTYLWTQLPLTVESMRHTRLQRVQPPPVLRGNKPHPVELFTWYQAHLGSDGKDEFTFKLEGAAELDIVLTKGMQGRLFLLAADQKPKPVDLVPPTESADAPELEAPVPEDAPVDPPEPEYSDCEEGCERDVPETPAVQPLAAAEAPPPPGGHRVRLQPGSYKLVTEHARGDVEIDYQLHLGSTVLMPGMTRTVPTPARLDVAVPRDGTLRLRTRGEADVRCRLFDRAGKLVFEGSDNGPDWNCSIAEPVTRGDYVLVLESETQSRSESAVTLSLAPVEDRGQAQDGMKLSLGTAVQTVAVPLAERDSVQSLAFKAKTPFSCALENGDGSVLMRRARVTDCSLLVRPKREKFRVRVWTTESAAQVTLAYGSTPAVVAAVASAGLWRTGAKVQCLPAARVGLLEACGPEASLEAGDVVFSEPVALEEVTAREQKAGPMLLSRRTWIEAVTAPSSVVLLEAHVPHGERAAPACAFGAGGVHDPRAWDCYAASAAGSKAIARLWAAVDDEAPIAAAMRLRAVAVPSKRTALKAGRQRLEWTGEAAAFELPGQAVRVGLTMPPHAWAVQLDDGGKAIDLCAPTAGELVGCTFTGRGGQVLLTGERELRADANVELLEAQDRAVAFNGLYEASARTPGLLKLDVPLSASARTLLVEGTARCVTTLSDGVRLSGCRAELPGGVGAELRVDHAAGPLRVLTFTEGRERQARLGVEASALPPAPVAASTAVVLAQGRADRVLVIERDAVVRVTASSGVCGLFKGRELLAVDGLDAGCEIVRVLSPGTYRAVVRPFDSVTVAGSFSWTQEPVVALKEGVGGEEWLSAGESRLYRFQTSSKGSIGFGVQAKDDALDCAIYDDAYRQLGEGCQQFLSLEKGSYLLSVKLPAKAGAAPLRVKPVLVGLAGAKAEVPAPYLEDFFRRNGGAQ